jgi:uncharacterized protein with GYD domain
MATFIALINFTQQGLSGIKDTAKRAGVAREAAQKAGASIREIYWTLGAYDGVLILDAPDDETATAVLLNITRLGNVHTQTLRAFGEKEMRSILGKLQ